MRVGFLHGAVAASSALLCCAFAAVAIAEQGWIVEEVRPEGAHVELPGGLCVDVQPLQGHRARCAQVKVRSRQGLRTDAVHPAFVPVGRAIEVGAGTEAQAEVSLPADGLEPREGHRLVVAVELVRDHRLPRFDPRVAAPRATAGRETEAWVFAEMSACAEGDRMGATVALVEGRRLQAGWLRNDLRPPWTGAALGVGRNDVTVCIPRRGGILELASGLRAIVRPTTSERSRRGECDSVTLRQARPLRPRSVHRSFVQGSPTMVVTGLGRIGLGDVRRVELRSRLSRRAPPRHRLVLAAERIANTSDCPMTGARGCEPRWEPQGFLFVAAEADRSGTRARARLPVPAQLGLRDGRLVFGWVPSDEDGPEILGPAAVSRSSR